MEGGVMSVDASRQSLERALSLLGDRAGLPNAPMAMPKQVLESQPRWLFAIYTRWLRRT